MSQLLINKKEWHGIECCLLGIPKYVLVRYILNVLLLVMHFTIIFLLQNCCKFSVKGYTKNKIQWCVPIETETHAGENLQL